MKLKENIKAILESNFSESKDEIKEIATESIIATVKASCAEKIDVMAVDQLPDVTNRIYLLPIEVKDNFGKTVTLYEEWVFRKDKIGVFNPDDVERIIKERSPLPYDAMGDYSNTPYSTGHLSPDEWYRENFGEYDKVKG